MQPSEPLKGVVDCVDPQTLSYEQVPDFLTQKSNLARFKGVAGRSSTTGPTGMKNLPGKTVMMYCTGGVRCERASSLLKSQLGEDAQAAFFSSSFHTFPII
jgi:rhodanese-related sulfurtransferase